MRKHWLNLIALVALALLTACATTGTSRESQVDPPFKTLPPEQQY
ncbi:MAG: hypothetical protein ACE5G5_12110 [Candidatus Methylomirabilales bacterium]